MMSAGFRESERKQKMMAEERHECHKIALLHLKDDDCLPFEIFQSSAEMGRGVKVYLDFDEFFKKPRCRLNIT